MRVLIDTHVFIWMIAQATIERLTIVSIDEKFNGYDVDRVW